MKELIVKLATPIMILFLIITMFIIRTPSEPVKEYIIDRQLTLVDESKFILEPDNSYKLLLAGSKSEYKLISIKVVKLQKHYPNDFGYTYAVVRMKESDYTIMYGSGRLLIFEVRR